MPNQVRCGMGQSGNPSRRVIDFALGVLVGLQGSGPGEGFAGLAQAVRRTGIGMSVRTDLVRQHCSHNTTVAQ